MTPIIWIRTTCPRCGVVELAAPTVVLSVNDPQWGMALYRFVCPGCAKVVDKPADAAVVNMLSGAGVHTVIRVPEPAPEPAAERPAFTPDDLLDFHLELQDDELLARHAFER